MIAILNQKNNSVKGLDNIARMAHHWTMDNVYKQFAEWGRAGGRMRQRRLLKSKIRRSKETKTKLKKRGRPKGSVDVIVSERNKRIIDAFMGEHKTLAAIASDHGITRERVRQILLNAGISSAEGGRSRSILGRKISDSAERERKRNERKILSCANYFGCTPDEYFEITGKEWRGISSIDKIARSYASQQRSAKYRGIPWELNFVSWFSIWERSGKLSLRGKGQHKYVMSRIADLGPYRKDNVEIVKAVENNSNRNDKKSLLPIGVSKNKGKYVATKMIAGKSNRIGSFDSPEEASLAYEKFTGG